MTLREMAEVFRPLWQKARPARGSATHDYTVRGPGHDYTLRLIDGGKRVSLMGWGEGIRTGDYLVLPNLENTTRYRVDRISYFSDPADMWSAEATFAPRTQ